MLCLRRDLGVEPPRHLLNLPVSTEADLCRGKFLKARSLRALAARGLGSHPRLKKLQIPPTGHVNLLLSVLQTGLSKCPRGLGRRGGRSVLMMNLW